MCAGAFDGTVSEVVKDAMSGMMTDGLAWKTPFHAKIAVCPACSPATVTGIESPRCTGELAVVVTNGPTTTSKPAEHVATGEQAASE